MSVRLLIIEDHPVVIDGLAAAIRAQDDIEVVGTASTKAQAQALVQALSPDVALVDVRLPDGLGLDLIDGRSAPGVGPRWLILSSFDTPQYVAVARARGAAGYLLKTAPLDTLVQAVREVAAGRTSFATDRSSGALAPSPGRLSGREASIVALLLGGHSNAEIAGRLGIALKTVEACLTRLYDRSGVMSRTELALKAQREGWIPPED